jgi:hypothetical protein
VLTDIGAHGRRWLVECATTGNPILAIAVEAGSTVNGCVRIVRMVTIGDPFHDITGGVMQTKGAGVEGPDRCR